jgi:hypothetical protein
VLAEDHGDGQKISKPVSSVQLLHSHESYGQ